MARDRDLQLALGIAAALLLVLGGLGFWLLGSGGDEPPRGLDDPDVARLETPDDPEEVKEALGANESAEAPPTTKQPTPTTGTRPTPTTGTQPTPTVEVPDGWRDPAFRPMPDAARVASLDGARKLSDDQLDIGYAALLLAREASPEVDIDRYLKRLDELARGVLTRLMRPATPERVFAAISDVVFTRNKFVYKDGGPDGIDPHNAYIDRVIDDRTGFCLSLSVLYLALAERIGLPLWIVEIPDHVFVRYEAKGTRINVETTSGGKPIADATYRKRHPFPKDAEGYYLRSRAPRVAVAHLLMSHALIHYKDGRLAGAEKALRAALAWDPEHLFARYNLANVALQNGDHAEARALYEEFTERRPDLGIGWLGLARAQLYLGETEKATAALAKAVRLDPKNEEVGLATAELAYRRGEDDRVITLTDGPLGKRLEGRVLRARALGRTGKHAAAELIWRELREGHPGEPEFGRKLGQCLMAQRKRQEAARVLRKLLRTHPKDLYALATLGAVLYHDKKPAEAVPLFERALTQAKKPGASISQSNLEVIYNNLARAQLETGRHDDAARTAVSGLRKMPRSQRLAHLAGMIYLNNLRDAEQARRYLQRYVKLGGTDPVVLKWLRENP